MSVYLPGLPLEGYDTPLEGFTLYVNPMFIAEWKVLEAIADLPKKKRERIRARLRRDIKRRGYATIGGI